MEKQIIYDDVFDAQEHYRLLLDSISKPGKINLIPFVDIKHPTIINNSSALIALALLNDDVTFCATENIEVSQFIALHTSAKTTELQSADFIFITGSQSSGFIAELKAGSLSYPEDSATIIADVIEISDTSINNSLKITLKGPGVQSSNTVFVSGLDPVILEGLKEKNAEFPLGIDLFLTDRSNRVIAIPRSNDIAYVSINDQPNSN